MTVPAALRNTVTVERKLPGWGFWVRWVCVSAGGFCLGAFLGMSLAWATVGVVAAGSEVTPEFFSLHYLDVKENGTYEEWHALKYSAVSAPGGEIISWTTAIAVGGLMLWFFLRKQVRWARWWALPIPLSFVLWGLMADVWHLDATSPVGGGVTLLAYYAKDFGLMGALCGAIVGVALVWFLRRSYRKSNGAYAADI